MRLRLLVLLAVAAVAWGCQASNQGMGAGQSRPVKIYQEGGEGTQPPSAEAPPEGLAKELKRQEEAVVKVAAKPAKPKEAGAETAAAAGAESSETASAAKETKEPEKETGAQEKAGSETPPQPELTSDYFLKQLEAKASRTSAEEETYKRLLGIIPESQPPAGSSGLYGLLGQARDAVLKGDFEAARERTSKALAEIRTKTNPVIEGVYFATEVRNYGNADVVSPAEFKAGQRVLLVTDLSNFACEPVGGSGPSQLYHTRMSQRIAIYDADGKAAFQKSYDGQEYQSSHYVTTMFIPRIFNLPGNMKPGEYSAKVEIEDALANRQSEAGVKFTVK